MSKILLVFHPTGAAGFRTPHMEQIFHESFAFAEYDPGQLYCKQTTVFVVNTIDRKDWVMPLIDQGYKVVVDNLSELPVDALLGTLHLTNANWFWYNESFWYQQLGYQQYQPRRTYQLLAFMPINRVDSTRDQLVTELDPLLADCVWSYRQHPLPNDLAATDPSWQRYFNPAWYDSTCFSFVVESQYTGNEFVTEKSFKPMAFQHPFVIFGKPGAVAALKQRGFETYENLFDEGYDCAADIVERTRLLINTINDFKKQPHDAVTLAKIQHNHQRFFDQVLVTHRIQQEIINPILEYANTAL